MKKIFLSLSIFILICFINISANQTSFDNWLYLGPIKTNFSDIQKTLSHNYLDITKLIADENLELNINGNIYKWKNINNYKASPNNSLFYISVYFTNNNFTKVTFTLSYYLPFELYIDGALKIKDYKPNDNSNNKDFTVDLEAGKHQIIIKSLLVSDYKNFSINAKLDSLDSKTNITFTVDPIRYVSFSDLLDNPKVKDLSVSPNGNFAVVNFSERNKAKNGNNSYFRIFDLKQNKEILAYRGLLDLTSFKFSNNDNIAAYTTENKNGTNLYIANLKTGEVKILLEEIKNFSDFNWSPNGKFIIYSTKVDRPKNSTGLKHYNNMTDRYPWNNSYTLLNYIDVESGYTYQLTFGEKSTDLNSISPDGKKLIYSVNTFISNRRPYSKTDYYILDIETLKNDSLFTMYWGGTALYSPNGNKIAVTGGPSEFNNLGVNLPDGVVPNDYDTQLYIFDIATKNIFPASKNFNPSISNIFWTNENTIYLTTTDKTEDKVYKYDLSKNSYTPINLDVSTIGKIDFDLNGTVAVFSGAKVNVPSKLFYYDLSKNKLNLLLDTEGEEYKYIKLGKVEDFNFVASNGRTIEGFVHYPVDFDPTKTYPCIVYYYGGTTPVEKEFEGRYPKNIWAANGYFVYVLEPSGCIGYGQQFSAFHVNDWGNITANEIIEGTKALINKYQNIDSTKLGCIGASYGGFMTMNLITKTNMFSAAVSHAGISALTSYWGNGYWGFSYSAVATAFSFPWNRQDIYVGHSPLFSADKINTPLLLLHGNSDTNVPSGESMQMYTALKLLGKPVELVEVDAQDHHILDYDKRLLWSKTILAFFDKYLKHNDNWWNFLYNKKND